MLTELVELKILVPGAKLQETKIARGQTQCFATNIKLMLKLTWNWAFTGVHKVPLKCSVIVAIIDFRSAFCQRSMTKCKNQSTPSRSGKWKKLQVSKRVKSTYHAWIMQLIVISFFVPSLPMCDNGLPQLSCSL